MTVQRPGRQSQHTPPRPPNFLSLLFLLLLALPASSVCPNNCNGHGTCAGYTCICSPPFSGDDCSFGSGSPPLSVGSSNVTTTNQFRKLTATKPECTNALVGFSAGTESCVACSAAEPVYDEIFADEIFRHSGEQVSSAPSTSEAVEPCV